MVGCFLLILCQKTTTMILDYFNQLKLQFNKLSRINKYSIAAFGFVIWLSFFDSHSLSTQYTLSKTIHQLKSDKEHYVEQLALAIKEKEELENNKEKFAREKFLFHKDNEEVIIIQNQK